MNTIKELEPQLRAVEIDSANFRNRVGILANDSDSDETRLLLTPEICGRLISAHWKVFMERDAAISISYSDESYSEYGVEICGREEALCCDIVLSYAVVTATDIEKMRDGSVLLCMFSSALFERSLIERLNMRHICVIALDEVLSHNGIPVFNNIVDDVDGSSAIWYAQEAMSFLGGGKGVLLGGVAGILPCEVLIIGKGRKVQQAAKTALALGAQVTLMDNDMSELQLAESICGPRLVTCAIHPRPLASKVKSADVIMIDSCTQDFEFPVQLKGMVKKDAFVLDFHLSSPSLSVPRTVSQGLATCLYNLFSEFELKDGVENTLLTNSGVCHGVVTYRGHLCNKLIGSVTGLPVVDLDILLERAN